MAQKPWFFTPVFMAAFSACAFCAEDEPPPFDAPEPTPSPQVKREEPDAPSATFEATQKMKSRRQREADAFALESEAENARKLEKVRAALAGLREARVELFNLDVRSEPKSDVDRTAHDPVKGGVFFGWKIKELAALDSADSKRAGELITSPRNYAWVSTGCFAPGMGLQWKDDRSTVAALICLHCRGLRFVLPDSVIEIPFSAAGRIAGARLYQDYFPSDKFAVWLKDLEMKFAEGEAKKKKSPAE